MREIRMSGVTGAGQPVFGPAPATLPSSVSSVVLSSRGSTAKRVTKDPQVFLTDERLS